MNEYPTTYGAWVQAIEIAKERAIESNSSMFIYFRSMYGWAISEMGGWKSDHYAEVFTNGKVCINKQTSKRLGRLWKR